jgi:hypothetical protein
MIKRRRHWIDLRNIQSNKRADLSVDWKTCGHFEPSGARRAWVKRNVFGWRKPRREHVGRDASSARELESVKGAIF